MSSNPRRDCDPHVVATIGANSGRYRIVAYNSAAMHGDPKSAQPYYSLAVDKLTENAMGESVWTALDSRSEGSQYARDHLLRVLLGLCAMDAGDCIEPRDRLGRHFRCVWAPEDSYGAYYDPADYVGSSAALPTHAKPFPLTQTLWAPTEWAARAIFQAMFGEAMTQLYAATKPTASSRMPHVRVRPCEDPDHPSTGLLPA